MGLCLISLTTFTMAMNSIHVCLLYRANSMKTGVLFWGSDFVYKKGEADLCLHGRVYFSGHFIIQLKSLCSILVFHRFS